MIINKDYMKIMRAGKNWSTYEIRKQNHAGVMLSACLLIAFLFITCAGLSPELQKAYNQLKKDGFNVSCREGL